MANILRNRFAAGVMMMLMLLGLTACSSGPIDRNTQFTLGKSLQVNNQSTSTIAVDLVGVNATDYKRWYNY